MDSVWAGLIQQFGSVVITFLGILFSGLAALMVQKFTQQARDLAASKDMQITMICRKAVISTQQQYKAKQDATPEDKMTCAMAIARKMAKERHLRINELTLMDRLEAEVYGMNNPPAVTVTTPGGTNLPGSEIVKT